MGPGLYGRARSVQRIRAARQGVWNLTSVTRGSTVRRAVEPVFATRMRVPGRRWIGPLALALALAATAPAQASTGWVGPEYFGINFQQLRDLGAAQRAKHVSRIASLGIHDIRVGFAWPRIEPLPPSNGRHSYRWTALDGEIATLARHHIRAQANITQTPRW